MTRVEKFHHYREEIANMKFESSSNKKTISLKIERMRGDNESSKLGYEQVLDVFGNPDSTPKKKHHFRISKNQLIYYSIAFVVIAALVVGIIIVAVNL